MAIAPTGTGALLRLALRRDRLLLPAWIVGFAAIAGFSARATADLYPDAATRVAAAELVNATPSIVALYGRIYDPTSLGALSLFKLQGFGAALVGILTGIIAIRHTRAEEEAGRIELLGASLVARAAPLTAAVVVVGAASVTLGALTAVGLIAAGLGAAGAVAFGAMWAGTGWVFGGLGAVLAQMSASARAARGWVLLAVAVSFVLRAIGDLAEPGPSWIVWASPIGWAQQVRAFGGDRWPVLALLVAAGAALVALAYALRARRDLGAGLLPERAGPAHGRITGAVGLAWRMQRTVLIAWLVGFILFGLVLGSLVDQVDAFLTSETAKEFIEAIGGVAGLTDAFLSAELSILGIIAAAAGIASALRLAAEEAEGRTERIIATRLTRTRWVVAYAGVALTAVVAFMTAAGVAIGVGYAARIGDVSVIGRVVLAAVGQIPAAWVLVGLVVAAYGWLPRLAPLVWAVFAAAVVLVELGPLWDLPQGLIDLAPFAASPAVPTTADDAGAVLGLMVVALGLLLLGVVGWRRRDLRT